MMKQVFKDVYVVKPESSRSQSAEAFVVGVGFREEGKLEILSESLSALKGAEEKKTEEKPEEDSEEDKLTF